MGVDHGDAAAPSVPVQRKYRYRRTSVAGIFFSCTTSSRDLMIGLVVMLVPKLSLCFCTYFIHTTYFTYDTYHTYSTHVMRMIQPQQQQYSKEYYRVLLLLAASCCCCTFAPYRGSRVLALRRGDLAS